jgi:hypothetical protein
VLTIVLLETMTNQYKQITQKVTMDLHKTNSNKQNEINSIPRISNKSISQPPTKTSFLHNLEIVRLVFDPSQHSLLSPQPTPNDTYLRRKNYNWLHDVDDGQVYE